MQDKVLCEKEKVDSYLGISQCVTHEIDRELV